MEGAIRSLVANGQQPQQQRPDALYQPTYQPPAPQQPQGAQPWAADDYVTGASLNQYAPRMIEQAMQPKLDDLYRMTADANLANVQRDNAPIFARYGPEVYAKLATVPRNLWTVDNLKTIVNLVRVDHVDELALERARQLAAEMEPALRSTGAGAAPVAHNQPQHTLTSEAVPQEWRDRAAKVGLNEHALDEFCRANGMTREDYFKQFARQTITETPRG